MSDEQTHTPERGDEYRNKNTVPGYGPGLLLIRIREAAGNTVEYEVIESNRLRTGPFIGVVSVTTIDKLEQDYEYMPDLQGQVIESETPIGPS